MFSGFKALAVGCLLGGVFAPAQAQTPAPLPVHAVRSINPADANFQDLEFLRQEIGAARVVMLGEPTHGEGNVFDAKARLTSYLHQRLGFTTLAFESGFYDLHKAQQELEAGKSAQEALGNSVFSVWTHTQEFQAVMPLIGKGKLRVAGFDPQLSGDYGEDLVDDLQQFLAPQKGAAALLNYEYLDEIISYMGEHFAFVPDAKLTDFEKELSKLNRVLDKVVAGPDARRRTEATFWKQTVRSLLAQARDYALHNPSDKAADEFKATDSNPRDAQMADNLLWYMREHPQEKVICWAALPHLANRTEGFADAEIQTYRPMGWGVKQALGADQVYILGTLAGGGTYGFNTPVPVPAAGSLEAELLAQPADFAFVSLKHDAPGRQLTTSAFEYKPLAGPWSEAVDGFLFLRSVNPPHGASQSVTGGPATDTTARALAPSTALNPAAVPHRARPASTGMTVRGVVLDHKSKAAVPYASVSVPGTGVGTVADGQGRFLLLMPGAGKLQISSVGYAPASVAPPAAGLLTVALRPSSYQLAGVQVRGESLDPRKIMKKVLKALEKNYELEDYSAEVYTHRQSTNYDTLTYETEYVSQVFEPAGYRHWAGGFLMLGAVEQHLVKEVHVTKTKGTAPTSFEYGAQGFTTSSADPVRISPLFKASTLRKFQLHLDSVVERNGNTQYLISFTAKRANHRSTGTYLTSEYSGRLYVQQRDYAVTHYEALWEADTAYINRTTRKYFGKHDLRARLYPSLLATSRTDHVVDYVQEQNGRYHVRRSVGQNLSVGRTMGGPAFHQQSSCTEYFTALPAGTPPLLSKAELTVGGVQKGMASQPKAVYRPEFWETYQRPASLDATLPAKP